MKGISIVVLTALLLSLLATPAAAADLDSYHAQNLLLSAGISLIGRWVNSLFTNEPAFKDSRDVATVLISGAAAGEGYFRAKQAYARGDGSMGMVYSNLAASVQNNVVQGYGPLDFAHVSLGFARIRIATPLASNSGPRINLDIDVAGVTNFTRALVEHGGSPRFEDGIWTIYSNEQNLGTLEGTNNLSASGLAYGSTIVLANSNDINGARIHEQIHSLQEQQMQSGDYFSTARTVGNGTLGIGVRTGFVSTLNNYAQGYLIGYDNWQEREAYSADGREVPR